MAHDARVAVVHHAIDAATPVAILPDAAVIEPLDAAIAPPARGAIIVVNDNSLRCEVTIDQIDRKVAAGALDRSRSTAGHHELVTCAQPGTDRAWTHEVEVAPGRTVTTTGTMLGAIRVTFDVDAKLDGAAFTRGRPTTVKIGRHLLETAGAKKYVDVRSACAVRDRPDLDCYPVVP